MADLTTSGPSNAEVGEAGRVMRLQERDERPCIFRYITAVVRTWGMLTAIGKYYKTQKITVLSYKGMFIWHVHTLLGVKY